MGDNTFFLKLSITSYTMALLLFTTIFLLNIITNTFYRKDLKFIKKIRLINFFLISSIFIFILLKFICTLRMENGLNYYIRDVKLEFYMSNTNLDCISQFLTFSSAFGDAIMLLSILVGLFCIDLLGPKDMFQNFSNISIFCLFNFFVILMVTTSNLLIMFISFECIFLPTMYFAYMLGYAKKIDKASELLFYWTLFGSFMVLVSLAYLYSKYNTLNYLYMVNKSFSKSEIVYLFITILIGFGIKIPVAPFHYWLLKVHVESPTAFSIFLSGFLVKSALYCIYMLLNLFGDTILHIYFMTWVLYSLIIGTWGIARQVDFKKLIAWATVQEMSFILLFFIFKQLFYTSTCILFLLLHGIMSSYMFYIVDIVQKRYKTRSIKLTMGLNLLCPKLLYYCWFLLALFSGFPLTIKFYIEWAFICMFFNTSKIIMLVALFIVNFLGVVFFCKTLIMLMYGSADKTTTELEILDINKKEKTLLDFFIFIIFILLFLLYII